MSQTIANGLVLSAIYALIALGYNLVFIVSGAFNFAQANLVTLGLFLAYEFQVAHPVPVWVVIVVCTGAIAVAGGISERVGFRYTRDHTAQLVTGVGIATILTGVVERIWGTDALQVPFFAGSTPVSVADARVLPVEISLIALAVLSAVAIEAWLRYTRFGLRCLAASENREAARARGIPVRRLQLAAFAIAGAFAGFVAVFMASKTLAVSGLSDSFAIKGFVAMAIGSFGSIPGCMVGALVLGVVESFTARYLGGTYQDLMSFGVLVLVLTLRPAGLLARAKLREV